MYVLHICLDTDRYINNREPYGSCHLKSPCTAQEFNSVEAIKGAVQYGLGAAFVSSAAIAKELDLGLFKRIDISGVRLNRTLSLVGPAADAHPCCVCPSNLSWLMWAPFSAFSRCACSNQSCVTALCSLSHATASIIQWRECGFVL